MPENRQISSTKLLLNQLPPSKLLLLVDRRHPAGRNRYIGQPRELLISCQLLIQRLRRRRLCELCSEESDRLSLVDEIIRDVQSRQLHYPTDDLHCR